MQRGNVCQIPPRLFDGLIYLSKCKLSVSVTICIYMQTATKSDPHCIGPLGIWDKNDEDFPTGSAAVDRQMD